MYQYFVSGGMRSAVPCVCGGLSGRWFWRGGGGCRLLVRVMLFACVRAWSFGCVAAGVAVACVGLLASALAPHTATRASVAHAPTLSPSYVRWVHHPSVGALASRGLSVCKCCTRVCSLCVFVCVGVWGGVTFVSIFCVGGGGGCAPLFLVCGGLSGRWLVLA